MWPTVSTANTRGTQAPRYVHAHADFQGIHSADWGSTRMPGKDSGVPCRRPSARSAAAVAAILADEAVVDMAAGRVVDMAKASPMRLLRSI